jgi:hypothetical protein
MLSCTTKEAYKHKIEKRGMLKKTQRRVKFTPRVQFPADSLYNDELEIRIDIEKEGFAGANRH